MRHLTTILTCCLAALFHAAAARAATPGPTCRSACAPRIAEQCGDRAGRELRRCRRPLLRACRATTPDAACPTTDDLTRALGDRRLELAAGASLRFCRDGRFTLVGPGDPLHPAPAPIASLGTWRVVATDSGLVVDLVANTPLPRTSVVTRAADGTFLVDGEPAPDTDATSECAAPPPIPPAPAEPEIDPPDPARVLAVTRSVTDRELSIDATDASGHVVNQQLTLCSSGALRVATLVGNVARNDRGAWTVDETGTAIDLALDDGLVPTRFTVAVFDDGRVLLDGQRAEVRDARSRCADIDLETRFTALLPGNVYATQNPGGLLGSSTLAFCDARQFATRITFTPASRGRWFVEATDGVVVVRLRITTSLSRTATLSLDDDGAVVVDGHRPVTTPAATLRFVCG